MCARPDVKARVPFRCDVCTRNRVGKAGTTRCAVCRSRPFVRARCRKCDGRYWLDDSESDKRVRTKCVACRPVIGSGTGRVRTCRPFPARRPSTIWRTDESFANPHQECP